MAYTALPELTASMGNYYELVIKPSYEMNAAYNQFNMKVSYGVRKIGANSATYNIDAAHMWASFAGVQVLGADGTHINWDQRQDPVGTYREYGTYSGIVQCNNSGMASVNVYAKFSVGNVSAAKDAEINRTITLPRIPRASTISATPTYIGQATLITIQRTSPDFRHTVRYSCLSLSGIIGAEKRTDTSFTWVVPTALYQLLPNSTSATVTLTCETYDGNTKIGQSTCSFTASVQMDVNRPTISECDVSEQSFICKQVTSGNANIVRYLSYLRCYATARPINGATIRSIMVNGREMQLTQEDGSVEINMGYFENPTSGTFVFTATDSRGISTSVTKTYPVIPYEYVKLSYRWSRPSATGNMVTLSLNGRFFNGTFGPEGKTNTLTVEVKVKRSDTETWGSPQTVTTTKTENTWKGTLTLSGIAYDGSYDVSILAYDILGSDSDSAAKAQFTIPPSTPVFDWGKNDLSVNKPMYLKDNTYLTPATSGGQIGFYYKGSGDKTTRLITGTTASSNNAVYVGDSSYRAHLFGKPLCLFFYDHDGGLYFTSSADGSTYKCCYTDTSNRLYFGEDHIATSIRGKTLTLGTTGSQTSIYGSYLLLLIPNNSGGIMVSLKNGSYKTAFWINASDEVYVGTTDLTTRLCGKVIYSSTNITSSSDRLNKKDIEPVSDAYEKLLDKIEPQRFRYKSEDDDAPYHVGYVAQDILAAMEDAGLDRSDLAAVAGEEGDLGIAYSELIPLLHKKVKSLEARVEQLEGQVAKLLEAQDTAK